MWFNGDVDHDRKITLTKGNQTIFEGDEFGFNSMYGPIRLNQTGEYSYYEANVIDDDPNFVMRGNVSVVGADNTSVPSSTCDNSNDQKILGSILVPAQDLQQYTLELQNNGLNVDSSYNFKDLMSGQEGEAGDEQTLLVWTANPAEVGFDQVIQTLQGITERLPYG